MTPKPKIIQQGAEAKTLYHGSSKKLIGKALIQKKPTDLEKNAENLHKGVFATDIKDLAISMAIICSKGIKYSSLGFLHNKTKGIIYDGWPKQKEFYLYTLPSKTFKRTGKIKHQFVSSVPVKPIKTEKLLIKDYRNLFRKATEKEKQIWEKKYGKF